MKKIFFIIVTINLLFGSRFAKQGDIIMDRLTMIQWQDSPITKIIHNEKEAQKRCEELRLGGFKDWRLPTKEEILSVVNYSKKNSLNIKNDLKDEFSNYDWEESERSYMTHYAWFVYFKYGYSDYFYKYYSNFIRCVRGGVEIEKKPENSYSKYRRK